MLIAKPHINIFKLEMKLLYNQIHETLGPLNHLQTNNKNNNNKNLSLKPAAVQRGFKRSKKKQ